jgi:hypothetical protein
MGGGAGERPPRRPPLHPAPPRARVAIKAAAASQREKAHPPLSSSLPQVDPESLERDNDRGIDLLGERVGALRQVCVRVCV